MMRLVVKRNGIGIVPIVVGACFFLISTGIALGAQRVSLANATLDIEPGARSAALGSATMAVDGDYLGLVTNAHQLSNVNYAWASFSHTAYYEDTQYDFASVVFPLGTDQGLGLSFSRFGADDIPYIAEGEPIPEGSNYKTLSIADWVFSASWGKKFFNRLELGLGFHGLYRDMDQSGWGFRGDASLRYRVVDQFYVSGLLKGWTSSAASWESGTLEYSSPEFYLAASYTLPVSYLYGKFGFYWQGAGLFHHESRDVKFEMDEDAGGRLWDDPLDWLSGGRGGIEFTFDFGLSLRVGLSNISTFESVTAGAGLVIAKFLRVDYAFESHPVLSRVHRLSISFSPYLFANPERKVPVQMEALPKNLLQAEEVSELDSPNVEESETPVEASDVQESPEEEILESTPAGGTYWEED